MKKEINEILGCRIKDLRKKKGITREALAEKLSVSTRFLADVESGKIGVSISTLKKLSIILNTSSDYLLGITNCNETNGNVSIAEKINRLDDKHIGIVDKLIDNILELISLS